MFLLEIDGALFKYAGRLKREKRHPVNSCQKIRALVKVNLCVY
jgi:hypothetical protein